VLGTEAGGVGTVSMVDGGGDGVAGMELMVDGGADGVVGTESMVNGGAPDPPDAAGGLGR
jgi:hypothetical protein